MVERDDARGGDFSHLPVVMPRTTRQNFLLPQASQRAGFHPTTRKSGAQWGPRLKPVPCNADESRAPSTRAAAPHGSLPPRGLTRFFSDATVSLLAHVRAFGIPASMVSVGAPAGVAARAAHRVGMAIGLGFFHFHPRLRRVGLRNLELAFPEMPVAERLGILRGVFVSLGRLLAEFPKFPVYSRENVSEIAVYDGFENFAAARQQDKGVLFLTAHLGGWEVGSFVHSVYGNTLQLVVRDLDNRYLNRLVRRYRTLHGNGSLDKNEFARGLLSALRRGDTVGILMDTNMTPPQAYLSISWPFSLYRGGNRPRCPAHRSRRGSRVHHLG